MISALISRLVILVFGTLYPAYSSYKAVKTKDIKLYVKWMMYWIVFALFTAAETFTDIFFSFWFPFYYELKICLVFWLLSPLTRGSSIIYRKVIHPLFMRREQEIDDLIAKAKDQGYNVILDIGCKSMTFATHAIMNTAVKGGSGLLFQLRKSYSLNDLTEDITNGIKETRRNRQIDCKDNFRGDEIIESKIMLTESQTDLDVTDDDTRFNSQEYRKTRKSSYENLALEDCREMRPNLRPRRSNRQDPENTRPISTKISPYYPMQPLFPSDYLSPFLYYSMTNKYLLPPSDKNLTQNFLNIRTNVNLYPNLKKASSTPNIFNESDNWILTDSLATESKESKKTETKKRRKRTAPKPPTDLPLIFVNSVSDQQIDVDRLAPYKLKTKAKQNKSKLQQFLSKSRELLHWKTDEGDSFSVRSDLSDDSVSTTYSYNTVLTPIRNSSTLPRKRQTKKRTI